MNVAFTGPHRALQRFERDYIYREVAVLPKGWSYFSGAAHGVDTECALAQAGPRCRLVVPAGEWYNVQLANTWLQWGWTVEYVEGGYMKRNDRLVELADVLHAFPETLEPQRRSGTWATIRRAEKAGIEIVYHPLCDA